MLRPNARIKAGNRYIATVKNPIPLGRLGLEGLQPGDRVICRFLDDYHIVLFDSRGNQTAPVQLAASGAIVKAEQVPEMNSHVNKHRKLRTSEDKPKRGNGISTFSGARR